MKELYDALLSLPDYPVLPSLIHLDSLSFATAKAIDLIDETHSFNDNIQAIFPDNFNTKYKHKLCQYLNDWHYFIKIFTKLKTVINTVFSEQTKKRCSADDSMPLSLELFKDLMVDDSIIKKLEMTNQIFCYSSYGYFFSTLHSVVIFNNTSPKHSEIKEIELNYLDQCLKDKREKMIQIENIAYEIKRHPHYSLIAKEFSELTSRIEKNEIWYDEKPYRNCLGFFAKICGSNRKQSSEDVKFYSPSR